VRVLITGATGFTGPYVAAEVARQNPSAKIFGLGFDPVTDDASDLFPEAFEAVQGDITDSDSVITALEAARPEIIFHLAAASSGAASWSQAAKFFEVNAIGTLKLLESVQELGLDPTTIVASSGEIYGGADDEEHPLTETAPYRPISPYASSKAAQDLIAHQFGEAYGTRVIRLRLFNQTGPRRPSHFVASSFARQIAQIELGLLSPTVKVGNLDARRDFIDVRDAARAYWEAVRHGVPGSAYNVCSGRSSSIKEILDTLVGLARRDVAIVTDPERMRPADIPLLVGDPSRFQNLTGWTPEIPLRQTLSDLLDWWREKV